MKIKTKLETEPSSAPMPTAVYLLALCQALMMSSTSLMITVSALIGYSLAEDKSLATLPLSLQFLGLMLTSIPAAYVMGRLGRKKGFIIGSLFGILGGFIAVWSILNHQYWWFAFAAFLVGVFNGFGTYYRFAAADISDDNNRPKAISYVLVGGVIAAFIGPNMANFGRSIFTDEQFAGGFIFVIGFYFMVLLIMTFINIPHTPRNQADKHVRSLKEIASQPAFIVAVICGMLGYAVMSYLMTATPLAMKHHSHVFKDTAFVIQWHVLAMFAPSFFTGSIIQRFGVLNVMIVGALLAFLSVSINLLGHSVWHFWSGLFVLGISWNFLFIGATSLLTSTYLPSEKNRAQGMNDFLVFTMVTIASLSAGMFQHNYGWKVVNLGALPLIIIIILSIVWLMRIPVSERVHDKA